MSASIGRSGSGAEAQVVDVVPLPCNHVSFVVGRALGTVVVTVHGKLDATGCGVLEDMLADLIEGQGNLCVAVALGKAFVEPEALTVFISAARLARRHGAKLILIEPPTGTHEVLQALGLGDLVQALPRRASGG